MAPAMRMAGERSSSARYFLRCGLLGAIWGVTFWIALISIRELIGGLSQTRDLTLIAIPVFTAGGFSMGLALRRLSPLPAVVGPLALAGASVGVVAVIAAGFYNTPHDVYAALAGLIYYSLAPAAALYPSALARRRRLRAYDRGDCPACGRERGAIETTEDGRCPNCKEKRRVCHNCLRLVSAATAEPCPRCDATIDAACWRCGYDWTGVHTPNCPECGVWKPRRSSFAYER